MGLLGWLPRMISCRGRESPDVCSQPHRVRTAGPEHCLFVHILLELPSDLLDVPIELHSRLLRWLLRAQTGPMLHAWHRARHGDRQDWDGWVHPLSLAPLPSQLDPSLRLSRNLRHRFALDTNVQFALLWA